MTKVDKTPHIWFLIFNSSVGSILGFNNIYRYLNLVRSSIFDTFTVFILVLVRYSIYRSIAILVNVRYRYLVVSRYFDISNIEWINDQSDDTWAIYKYRVSNEISSIVWYDSWTLKPGLYFECKSTPYTVIRRPFCALGARFPGHQCRSTP